MNSNINQSKITSYSKEFSSILLDSFFANRDKILGEEIMNLSVIKQVNLFALKELFGQWDKESKKLESPYFDYEAKEVVEAVENFKNTVSRHIAVVRADFEPILEKATSGALLLIFSPYQYYLDELTRAESSENLPYSWFSDAKKFTKVNTSIMDELTKRLDNVNEFDPSQLLDEVIDNMSSSPEDTEPYLKQFSSYLSIQASDIYMSDEHNHLSASEPSTDIEHQDKTSKQDIGKETSQNFVVKEESPTVNDAFTSESKETLADVHSKQKIDSLSKGIMLNQRFMFVNILFEGDVAKFNNTVLELDGLQTLDEAKKYLNAHFGHWSKESYEVEEFRSILERRYR